MFTTPLGLTALLGVPVVLALHLFHRRFPERSVSALFLWDDRHQNSPSGRRRHRLIRTPSFWCEILAALCLGLALGGPRACSNSEPSHLVVALDASASMAARPNGPKGPSLANLAVQTLRKKLAALPADSRCTVITSGLRPKLLAGPAALPSEAMASLEDWQPSLAAHDPTEALALATEFSGGSTVLFLSDHLEHPLLAPNIELISIGEAAGNLAINNATSSPIEGGQKQRVTVSIQSFNNKDRSLDLSLLVAKADGAISQVITSTTLKVKAGERTSHSFDLPAFDEAIEIRISDDALELDNRAWIMPEPKRQLVIATTFNAGLTATLGLSSSLPEDPQAAAAVQDLDRLLDLIPNSTFSASPESAHLVFGGAQAGGPRAWTLSIEAPGPERAHLIGPFLKALGNPLVSGLTLQGIVWSRATNFSPPGSPLISAGDAPLYTRAGRVFHLNLDPLQSSLTSSPDWPVLLSNLAEARRKRLPGPRRVNLRTGEELIYTTLEPSHFRLFGNGIEPREANATSELRLEMPSTPGLFQLERRPHSQTISHQEQLAINLFAGAESDLRSLKSGERPSQASLARAQSAPNWLQSVLILGALIALVLDGLLLAGRLSTR